VAALREEGHSLRAIAGAVRVDEKTVRNDLATADRSAVPDRVTGLDGKSRPSRRQKKGPKDPKPKSEPKQPKPAYFAVLVFGRPPFWPYL
jgi:hypothetical protein